MRIGEFEVAPIVDAEGSFAQIDEVFPALNPELRAEAERRHTQYFRGTRWWLPVQVVLIQGPDLIVLVDTGLGPKPREFMPTVDAHLDRELKRLGVAAEDVGFVIHTHLHIDHVGWNGTFPNARYLIHEDDLSFFLSPEGLDPRPHLREKVLPLRDSARIDPITGPAEPIPGITIVPTPGHTPGHVSVRVGSDDEALLVLGDALVHPVQILDPEAAYAFDEDKQRAVETRKMILRDLAAGQTMVIAAHLHGTGRVVGEGDTFGWMSVSD